MKTTTGQPQLGKGSPRGRKRLRAARLILEEVSEHLKADFSVELWSGELIPMRDGARDDLRIVITSPDAVRRLLLGPNLVTLLRLVAAGDIRLSGGSPHEILKAFQHGDGIHLVRRINKAKMLRHALPFILGGPANDDDLPGYERKVGGHFEERQDRDLISFHYDVSNAFFRLFLDEEMVYSSAYYRSDDETLEQAQLNKLDMICRKLRLKPGETLLDIGCGWGSLACFAAEKYGVHVHGLTLSQEQLNYAREKVLRLGLEDKVKIELRDYRTLMDEGVQYDKVAQVEMFEHVGWDNFDTHFHIIRKLLKSKGIHYHQATCRRGGKNLSKFRKPTKAMQFVTTYIFPGGELDYVGNTITNMGRLGLEVMDVECLREHFILTLKAWERRLKDNREAAVAEAGEARTMLWQLYFALFIQGFERTVCTNYSIVAVKREPGRTAIPLDRSGLYT